VIVVFLNKEKTNGRTLLHCAIYPNAGFRVSLLNCSASGKKRVVTIMLERLLANRVLRSYSTLCSFGCDFPVPVLNLLIHKHRTGLAKVAVQCSADTFVVNQNLVLRINICGENRHLRQARKR
jgi:hypothetical protein